jgi:Ca-activated chloride channel family protein
MSAEQSDRCVGSAGFGPYSCFIPSRTLAVLLASVVLVCPAFGDDASGKCQTDAMIVFDASGSMGTTDYALKLPRIARAKNAMATVLPEVAPLRRLGLIVYGEGAYNDCNSIELRMKPAANAASSLLDIIEDINPRGRTPLTRSVELAAESLDYHNRPSTIVLLTDGEETCGGDPCKTAKRLKAQANGLTIHVIGYREQGGYFAARCMSEETGGEYTSVKTEEELTAALRQTLGCPFVTEYDTPRGSRAMRTASVRRR